MTIGVLQMTSSEVEQVADIVSERLAGVIREGLAPLRPTHISAKQYAAQRGLSLRTVRNLIASGHIPIERHGRRVLIPVATKGETRA